ncbi:hypothetical protein H5P36_10290 [Bacillus sp. APMAM]|uniref:hypothetical protein n=1 Tax=Margalitia sp. FSL K6-0131 TaxID=2954604 RepID=UPI001602EE78|nr:hypothetical protein [Bacillus sp. APMAM]
MNDDGAVHNRSFYRIAVSDVSDEWDFQPTGDGEEQGLTIHFFWIKLLGNI